MRHGYRGGSIAMEEVGETAWDSKKNYRYVESVADLRTAASRRGHQR